MRRTKIIPIRLVEANHDTDWDGVPNRKDCQPFNPHKQETEGETINTPIKTPLIAQQTDQPAPSGYQYAQPAPSGYQYVQPAPQIQQFQIPPRMYDESVVNLPNARFTFLRFI